MNNKVQAAASPAAVSPPLGRYIASACAIDQKAAPAPVDLVTEVCDLPSRLTFLRMLKERTVFAEHAVLSLIIRDYERALKLRTKDDDGTPSHDKKSCTQRRREGEEGGPMAAAKPKEAETSRAVISLQQVRVDRENSSDRGTVEVCEALLKRALSGELRGLIGGFIDEGEHMVCVTGHFRENPVDLIGMTSAMDDRVKKHFGGTVKAAVKP